MRLQLLGALVAASLCAGAASADGRFIAADGASDMAYDGQADIVYIAAGSKVLRYQIRAAKFLSPIDVGGSLFGIDLSPDGTRLAIADGAAGSDHYFVIDTKSLAVQKILDPDHGQTFGVAYLPNGDLIVSGFSVQRRSATTGQWTLLTQSEIGWHDVSTLSGDGSRLGVETSGYSPAPWSEFDPASGTTVAFNTTTYPEFEIAVNHDGSQVVLPTYGGIYVYAQGQFVTRLGQQATSTAVGGAYDPVRALAYFPWSNTSQVRIFDMNALRQVGALEMGKTFEWSGNSAYVNGRTKLSRDGSLLMVSVQGGVQVLRLYAALAAANVTASVTAGSPVDIPVSATLGVAGDFTFGVAKKPAHGTAKVVGNSVVYTPDFSFSGTETFTYQAHYSQAAADGRITVQVAPFINHAPVAANDTIALHQAPGPVLLDVLANDSDADGQALAIVSATNPRQGTAVIQGGKILYTPSGTSVRNDAFSYTVSDGTGGTASATAHVLFVPAN